jgi:hypothetical protein
MSLEEFLCRHATQFLAASLRKLKDSAPTTFCYAQSVEAYIAGSANSKLSLAEIGKG